MKNVIKKIIALSISLIIVVAVIFGIFYILEVQTLDEIVENFIKIAGVIFLIGAGASLLSLITQKNK